MAGGGAYVHEPPPAVIIQDNRFDATDSITVCAFTADPTAAPLFRLLIKPSEQNGLKSPWRLMVDKITTVRKTRLGTQVGVLGDEDLVRLNRALIVFLGLAGSSPA